MIRHLLGAGLLLAGVASAGPAAAQAACPHRGALDDAFCDANRDLVADVPTDAARLPAPLRRRENGQAFRDAPCHATCIPCQVGGRRSMKTRSAAASLFTRRFRVRAKRTPRPSGSTRASET